MYAILVAAIGWAQARQRVLALSIGAPDYRKHLNELSEAEDRLQRAVKAWESPEMMRKHARQAHIVKSASEGVVTSQDLGRELEVSDRTIYRDVKALQKQGVPIVGEAGMGYMICKKGERNGQQTGN